MIFETHAHYDDDKFNEDRGELISKLPSCGIKKVINVSSNYGSIDKSIELAHTYTYVYAAVGIHPEDIEEAGELDALIEKLRVAAKDEKVIAIGEIGLDYYWEKDEKKQEIQKEWFIAQMNLARELKLPVIIHSRDAGDDTLRIMKEIRANEIKGVIHCYSYSPEMAREFLKMGYYIGVGGVVTFTNGKKLVNTVIETDMERILLETDSPYLSPVPFRGKRNDSTNLAYVVEKIAELKNLTAEEVENITFKNAEELFEI